MYPFSWKPLTLGIGALLPVVGMTGLVGAQQTPKPKSAAAPSPKTVRKPPVSVPAETIPPEQVAFFETKIRPVLVKNCYSCHSEKAGMGGLYLDSRESIRRGGDTGPAIVPGDPAKSLLLRAISHQGRLRMPPSGKLSDDVITDFTTWVKMGAPDPRLSVAATPVTRVIDIAKGKRFWSFQPPRKPAVPTTLKNRTWARSDLDRFVLEKLEAKGLTPAKDADRRTLIRRVYYDLTGLPPTPAEVNAFLADTSPDAYAKVVDRLLASPEYGRRWGRHWLDVARYAESSGKERNIAYPHAWRYRDWVIDAFNRDKPYDRFLKEQLAGDLLPADTERQRAEQVIATGFLAIGPKSHGTRSAKQFQMDVADEQIDAMSQGMLGLTIACARCHDHKFDPIPTKDYYALAGIFTSTETRFGGPRFQAIQQSTPLIELPNIPELPVAANVYSPSEVARLREQLTRLQEERQNLLREARAANDPRRAAVNPNFIRISAQIANLETGLAAYDENGQPKKLAMGVQDRFRPADSVIYVRGELDKPGDLVPRGFAQVLCNGGEPTITEGSGRRELAEWVASKSNPLTARVMVNRIWLHLFGRGIVPTPDNFGTTGQKPSNPKLLDHLAVAFMENGWSVKSLIRQIVLSRTYRMSSDYDAKNYAVDPDNILQWRMSKRRLEAEAIRDGMMQISGLLSRETPAGSPVARMEGLAVARPALGMGGLTDLPYRAVYLPIVRDQTPEVLAVFDFAETSLVTGARETTTVPSQALYLMNSPFVQRQANAMAERLLAKPMPEADRIRLAFELAFCRPPSAGEIQAAAAFFEKYQATQKFATASATPTANRPFQRPGPGGRFGQRFGQAGAQRGPVGMSAWAAFCQALLGSAEFRYLD